MTDPSLSPDPSVAEAIVSEFLSDPAERRVALNQLVASADYAATVAPAAWSVTLYRNKFRLNVGRVEVFVVGNGFVRFNCVGRVGRRPFTGAGFEDPGDRYKSVPDPKCSFVGSFEEFAAIRTTLQPYHHQFIDAVGRKRTGEPVSGSPNLRSHSDGLMSYARAFNALPAKSVAGQARQVPGAPVMPLGNEMPQREAVSSQRIVRDTAVTLTIKGLYRYQCPVCGVSVPTASGPYAEGAHIRPLGSPHNGPDIPGNVLCLCPNHHVMLDGGSLSINDDLTLNGAAGKLRVDERHTVDPQFLKYQRNDA